VGATVVVVHDGLDAPEVVLVRRAPEDVHRDEHRVATGRRRQRDVVAAQDAVLDGKRDRSAEAVDDLGLEPGVLTVAVVKATNVVVERPR